MKVTIPKLESRKRELEARLDEMRFNDDLDEYSITKIKIDEIDKWIQEIKEGGNQ